MSGPKLQIHLPGEGRSVAAAGVSVLLKSAAEDTESHWTLYEYTAPPRFAGPPPHWHKETDEAFFVVEGTLAGVMAAAPSWPPEDLTPVMELMARYDTFRPPAS